MKATLLRVSILFFSILPFSYSALYAFDGYGVCAMPFTKEEEKVSPEVFKLLKEAGAGWVRIGYRWDEIEPRKDVYDFSKVDYLASLAQKNGLKVLGLLNRTPEWASGSSDLALPPKNIEDWKRFVSALVSRYKGRVTHWEVWNEPDIKKFWKGDAEGYVVLLKEAYFIIKAIDPSAKVVSAGLDGNGEKYLPKLLELGLASYCDIIAFHPYGKTPKKSLERVKNFLEILKKHDVEKPLWFTEIGWQTTPYWHHRVPDEKIKAEYLAKTYHLLMPFAEVIFWYRALDKPGWYGLITKTNAGLITTPAYKTYQDLISASHENSNGSN